MIDTEYLREKFLQCRKQSEFICKDLEIEDYSVQPVVDVSPPKWHLAHTTWFFEQFILVAFDKNYKVYNDDFAFLFNSYYNNAGDRVLRPNRGLMTRPTVKEVYAYRNYVTEKTLAFLSTDVTEEIKEIIEIGINHEEQHQELLAYDIKYILGHQPTFPNIPLDYSLQEETQDFKFLSVEEGVYEIGHVSNDFCFDNELGVHKTYIQPFSIANKLVTNREFIEFIEDSGYRNFNLWHAAGWDWVQQNNINAPLYWHFFQNKWHYYHTNGFTEIDLELPVMNISYYEAFAFAEWKKMRLPTEFEWEVASEKFNWGQLWEWTASAYLPYPNFKKADGALGEYNGKFMVNLHVLRGASMATPKNHSRKTYRNFFHPELRWMFSGIRLVK
ncbi:ergothioneine biosynthesis protein EgtB [Tenacibaculum xiamenense]|uniref:ergothioneine biosynthesis protein EgtB n=1 Tax=Tenacibaculum xiamenense TaxID=1261553 RepID=UPI003894F805